MKAITSNFNANTEKHTHIQVHTVHLTLFLSLSLWLAVLLAHTHTHMSFKFYTHCRLMAQVIFYCRRLLPLSDLDSACLIQITKIHTRIQAHTHKLTRTHTVAHTHTHIMTARPLPSLCLSCFLFLFAFPPTSHAPCVSSVCV